MNKKQIAKLAAYTEELKRIRQERQGNDFAAINTLDEIEAYNNATKISKTVDSRNIKPSKRDVRRAKKIDKEVKKSRETLDPNDKYTVFEYQAVNSIFNKLTIVDKFVAIIIARMKEKGQLDFMKSRNNILIEEKRNESKADCYKFLNYVINKMHVTKDTYRFKIDSKMSRVIDEVIANSKFKRYEFKFLHRTVVDEPTIMEVSFRD